MPLALEIGNTFEEICPAAEAVAGYLTDRDADEDAVYLARLAVEELLTNILKYGYDDREPHRIRILLEESGAFFELSVKDDGHPFDPCTTPDPDTSLPAPQRTVGGLGLFLLRSLADEMTYSREGGCNVVRLRKRMRAG